MKLNRIRKNALYMMGYGCSSHKFKRIVKSSPDNNIKRIPARQLARIIKDAINYYTVKVVWVDECN